LHYEGEEEDVVVSDYLGVEVGSGSEREE